VATRDMAIKLYYKDVPQEGDRFPTKDVGID
jgi:hypothetical protein